MCAHEPAWTDFKPVSHLQILTGLMQINTKDTYISNDLEHGPDVRPLSEVNPPQNLSLWSTLYTTHFLIYYYQVILWQFERLFATYYKGFSSDYQIKPLQQQLSFICIQTPPKDVTVN